MGIVSRNSGRIYITKSIKNPDDLYYIYIYNALYLENGNLLDTIQRAVLECTPQISKIMKENDYLKEITDHIIEKR